MWHVLKTVIDNYSTSNWLIQRKTGNTLTQKNLISDGYGFEKFWQNPMDPEDHAKPASGRQTQKIAINSRTS